MRDRACVRECAPSQLATPAPLCAVKPNAHVCTQVAP